MLRRYFFAAALAAAFVVVAPGTATAVTHPAAPQGGIVIAGSQAADLAVSVTDSRTTVRPGQSLLHVVNVDNNGPNDVADAHLVDAMPPGCASPTWSCSGNGSCPPPGVGDIDVHLPMPASSRTTFRVVCPVDASAGGTTLTQTATVAAVGGIVDPGPANNSATDTTYVIGDRGRELTKTVTGTFRPGGAITYTLVLGNITPIAQADNDGPELFDSLPGGLDVTSMTATSGALSVDGPILWNGALPAGGSVTITINATIDPALSGEVHNQARALYDSDGNGSNDSTLVSDDPATAAPDDVTIFNAVPYTKLEGTMTVGGLASPGSDLYYIVYVINQGGVQADNPGDEFVDVLPAGLTLVDVSILRGGGTAVADVPANTVRWNGPLGAAEFVQLSIHARIDASARGVVANQGVVHYDADADGINETSAPTDDPNLPGASDPTSVTVTQRPAAFDVQMYAYGDYVNGGVVSYDVIVQNFGGTLQHDNPGDELSFVLPEGLTYIGNSVLHGTTAYDAATRTFTWNGEIAAGSYVGMTITSRLPSRAAGTYATQATFRYDADENGTNESVQLSDNTYTSTPGDATVFVVVEAIPALGLPALAACAVGMWWVARVRLRRRHGA